MKKVSIIIPVHNKEKYVQEAIQSALNQTYKNIEIVVIDDASTDGSAKKVLELAKKHSNIVFVKENVNLGVSLARNKAISIATGEYIFPLDADDYIDKTFIEKAALILDKNPKVGVVYCNFRKFQGKIQDCPCEVKEDKLVYENCCINGSMYRKTDFYKVGQYKKWLNRLGGEDWELWMSFLENGFEFKKIDEYLYYYRIDSRNKTMVDVYIENTDEIQKLLFEHHTKLYINTKGFLAKVFDTEYPKYKYRAIKYKKLFNLLLPIAIAQLVLNLALILTLIFKFRGGGG